MAWAKQRAFKKDHILNLDQKCNQLVVDPVVHLSIRISSGHATKRFGGQPRAFKKDHILSLDQKSNQLVIDMFLHLNHNSDGVEGAI